MCSERNSELDVVGIGFGPSNLALAIAVEEHNDALRRDDPARSRALEARFFEKKTQFGWHPGMLLPGATLQVSSRVAVSSTTTTSCPI